MFSHTNKIKQIAVLWLHYMDCKKKGTLAGLSPALSSKSEALRVKCFAQEQNTNVPSQVSNPVEEFRFKDTNNTGCGMSQNKAWEESLIIGYYLG